MSADELYPKTILVPEAHALGMLAAIRSLGRAGHRILGASPKTQAIGFHSRYCTRPLISPDFDDPDYVPWLRRLLAEEAISAIIPGGAFLLAIAPKFEEFRHLLPIAPDRRIVYTALSKTAVFEAFSAAAPELRLLAHHPPTRVVARGTSLPDQAEIAALGSQVYLKADALCAGPGAEDLLVGPLPPAEALPEAERALKRYERVLLQGSVSGRQAGVSLLMGEGGRTLASNCFIDVHLAATRRGTMSLRRTWQNDRLVDDAIRRLRHLRWQGAAMLEYRVIEEDGSFNFIELNPRYWQSLHLDLLAGVDFPRLQLAWFKGAPVEQPESPRPAVCRDLWPGEISHMLEIWRSPRFGMSQRLWETGAFLTRLLDLRISSDYLYPGDRSLYWHRVAQVLQDWLRQSNRP